MTLKNLTKEELENMSYDDIAYEILKETNKKYKTTDLFKEVCNILNMSEKEYENQIAEFFQVLSTDQRFTMVKDGYWDLKIRHRANIVIDDEEEDDLQLDQDNNEEEIEEDYYDDNDEDNDEDNDDDLKDLVIINEEDQESDLI